MSSTPLEAWLKDANLAFKDSIETGALVSPLAYGEAIAVIEKLKEALEHYSKVSVSRTMAYKEPDRIDEMLRDRAEHALAIEPEKL